MDKGPIQVLIIDDEAMIRKGIVALPKGYDGIAAHAVSTNIRKRKVISAGIESGGVAPAKRAEDKKGTKA